MGWPKQTYSVREAHRIYSIKRLPRLSIAYESKNTKERHPQISAAFRHLHQRSA